MTTIGIVACSKTKLAHAAPAKDLYTSQLFRATHAHCEASYDRWLILSALHGLVEPDQIIEPYDLTLTTMSAAERREWAAMVSMQPLADDLRVAAYEGMGAIYLHAGVLYRQAFQRGKIMVPLEGLGIGQQLGWYAARARERAA